jgi:hypothetical protein
MIRMSSKSDASVKTACATRAHETICTASWAFVGVMGLWQDVRNSLMHIEFVFVCVFDCTLKRSVCQMGLKGGGDFSKKYFEIFILLLT